MLGLWERYEKPQENWYKVTFNREGKESVIQLDVLTGCFLVDGRPVGRLPVEISNSDCYARLFGDHVFDVQPAHDGQGFKTSQMNGVCFGFFVDTAGDVIITEERQLHDGEALDADGDVIMEKLLDGKVVKATLVPHENFQDDLPISLVHDHSHWLVKVDDGDDDAEGSVYLRPIRFDHRDFQNGCSFRGACHVLRLSTRKVVRCKDSWELVDVRSRSFEEVYGSVLSRLEDWGYIHIHHHGEDTVAVLPRLVCFSGKSKPFLQVGDAAKRRVIP